MFFKFTCLLLFIALGLSAQNKVELTGAVLDEQGNPIPYAHLGLKNGYTNIISNQEGNFALKIDAPLPDDTLIVTAIGFKDALFPLNALNAISHNTLVLSDTSYLLSTVSITSKTPEELLKEVLERRKETLISIPFTTEGFFRTSYAEDNKYVKMLEATVKIYNPDFQSNKKIKAALTHIRKSNDYSTKIGYENNNWLYKLFELLQIHSDQNVMNPANFHGYEFKLKDVTIGNNSTIYIIEASISDYSGQVIFHFYIDYDNMAFARIDYTIQPHKPLFGGDYDNIPNSNYFLLSAAGSELYQPNNGKYFLKNVWTKNTFEIREEGTNKKITSVGLLQELLIHDINLENPKKPKYSLPQRGDIYYVFRPYDPSFWANYNRPVYTKIHEKIKADLEFETPLVEQYLANGAKDSAKAKKKFQKNN